MKTAVSPAARLLTSLLGAAGTALFAVLMILKGYSVGFLIPLVFFALILLLGLLMGRKKADSSVERYRKHDLNKKIHVLLDDDGVELKINGQKSYARSKYKDVYSLVETEDSFFLEVKGLAWINRIGSNYLKLYPDIGNTTNGCLPLGPDPAEDLRSGGSAVAALHLKETKPGFYREIPYGTGHVDFERAVAAAWAIGVRRFVREFWYKPDGETPEAVCKRCRALLDQQLQE